MKSIAIVGGGPAALMVADRLLAEGTTEVHLFEKRPAIGRKLRIAGSSGLNVTHAAALEAFAAHYGEPAGLWLSLLRDFPPAAWLGFLHQLGLKTFRGTSGRYFIEDKTAERMIRLWQDRLTTQGVHWHLSAECVGYAPQGEDGKWTLRFADGSEFVADGVCFALGGATYERQESPLRWPRIFEEHGLLIEPFRPSNVGYKVNWPEAFLTEAEGKPLKNITLTSAKGSRQGDVVVTKYGLEGTPVYFVGQSGDVVLDLKTDLSAAALLEKCQAAKENLSPIRRLKKYGNLGEAAQALVFHLTPAEIRNDLPALIARVKEFPLTFLSPQPIDEAISSAGGLSLSELNEDFMLKKHPGVFAIGEMLDWDAPTGGFLIQGCISQAVRAARGILSRTA